MFKPEATIRLLMDNDIAERRARAEIIIKEAEDELADEDRPIDRYDLSALYLEIGVWHLLPLEEKTEILGKELRNLVWRQIRLVRIVNKIYSEVEQIQGHLTNLDKRVFALEKKRTPIRSDYD